MTRVGLEEGAERTSLGVRFARIAEKLGIPIDKE